jgi:hypothetical protein
MFFATINKSKQLLFFNYIDHVTKAELERGYDEIAILLTELSPDFRLLVDYGRMESLDLNAVDIIGKTMELLEHHGLDQLVRVMPDPSKDIGLRIIGIFHFKKKHRIIVCENMAEAARKLGL